ncbi:MAG: hypothetical protein V4489_01860 [Chlamydiota bacterium]
MALAAFSGTLVIAITVLDYTTLEKIAAVGFIGTTAIAFGVAGHEVYKMGNNLEKFYNSQVSSSMSQVSSSMRQEVDTQEMINAAFKNTITAYASPTLNLNNLSNVKTFIM